MNRAGKGWLRSLLLAVFCAALIGGGGTPSAEETAAPPPEIQILLDRLARQQGLDEAETRSLERWARRTAERLSRGDAGASGAALPLHCPDAATLPANARPPDLAAILAMAARHGDRLDAATRRRLDRIGEPAARPGRGADLGAVLVLAGAASSAVYLAGQSLAATPRDAVAANNLAVALAALGDPAGADAAFAYALSLEPDTVTLLENRGWGLFAAGRFAAAGPVLERALALDPDRPAALAGLAALSLCGGHPAEAAALAARSLDQGYVPAASRILQAAARAGADPPPADGPPAGDAPGDAALVELALPARLRDLLSARSQIAGAAVDLDQELQSYAAAQSSLAETLRAHGVDLARGGRSAGGTRDGHTLIYPVGDDRALTRLARLKGDFDRQAAALRAGFDRALPPPGPPPENAPGKPEACGPVPAALEARQAAFIAAWSSHVAARRQLLGRYLAATAAPLRSLHDGQIGQFYNLARTTALLGTYADALDLANGWIAAIEPLAGAARCPAGTVGFAVAPPKVPVIHGQPCAGEGFAIDLQALKLAADCQSVRISFAGDAAGIEEFLPLDGIALDLRLAVTSPAPAAAAIPFVTFDGRRAVDEGDGPLPRGARLLLAAFWRGPVPPASILQGVGADETAIAAPVP